jgi:hypothetical protein
MIAGGRKDNAEAQRTQRFAEQEGEARPQREIADFAEEWESESDGGLGTSCLPFLCGREVEVRGCELRRVAPSQSEADGSAPADSPP